jgi:hypothetical protein
MNRKRLIVGVIVLAVLAGAVYIAYARWFASSGASRESLLQSLPADASAAIYVDVAELRQGAILKNLVSLGAGATNVDQDYKQFVNESGFDYEKDLNRVGVAIQSTGPTNHYLVLADGRFNRPKIEMYLQKNGSSETKSGREIFHLRTGAQGHRVSAAFLSNDRIALTDAPDLNAEIESARQEAGHREWMERFERLAGSPMFALFRQDAAIGAILNTQAPGGFRSPQLAQLLNQLLWISIAGKPEGNGFRVAAEGECPNELTMRQLADFLSGIALMAQGGLNDPKLRQQMDPSEREAYLQLLNSVEVTKLDRGTSKSVRMAMMITPDAWSSITARKVPTQPLAESQKKPADLQINAPSSKNKKAGTKVPAKLQ